MPKENDFYQNLEPVLSCKDYTVSNEIYQLKKNIEYDMFVTIPVPDNLQNYYKSENYISHTDS